MTVKRIFKYPSNEIKTKCENFDISSDDFTIFKDLYDTMNYYNQNDIISFITANQIGYNKNIAIITGKLDDPSYWFIVNPVISNYSNHTTSQKEFSVSSVGFSSNIDRSNSIKIEYTRFEFPELTHEKQDSNGITMLNKELDMINPSILKDQEFLFTTDSPYINTLQAVVDQLNGLCFIDKLTFYNKNRFKKHVEKIKRKVKQQLTGSTRLNRKAN